MNCRTARGQLLTADLTELEGHAGTALSLHIASCAACRRAADLIREAMRALDAHLEQSEVAARVAAVRRALAQAAMRRARARRVRRAVPVAAAAVLAGLLIVRHGFPPTATAPLAVPAPPSIHDVTVTAPPGRSVAVWHTEDPRIVVVWFF